MHRWKLNLQPISPTLPQSVEDYLVTAAYNCIARDRYFGKLKVVRLCDRRVLYPYDGAEAIGPFPSGYEAREAANELGRRIVDRDLVSPEE